MLGMRTTNLLNLEQRHVKIRGGTVRRDYFAPGELVCKDTLLGFLACNLASSALLIIDVPNLETKQIFRVQDLALLITCDGVFNHIEDHSLSVPCISEQDFR